MKGLSPEGGFGFRIGLLALGANRSMSREIAGLINPFDVPDI